MGKMVGGCLKVVGGVVVVLIIALIGIAVAGESGGSSGSSSSSSSSSSAPAAQSEEAAAPVEYQDVDINELFAALESNALNAKNTYEGMPVRVTGVLSNIDASGNYFDIGNGDSWSFDSITCYIKNDETLDRIASSTTGDTLTVCGTVSQVGEIIGYSINVDHIE